MIITAPRNTEKIKSRGCRVRFYKGLRPSDIEFIEHTLGYTLHKNGTNGWMRCTGSIDSHRDRDGKCLVFCTAGAGLLQLDVFNKSALLTSDHYAIFDDRDVHSLTVFKPMTLLVVNVLKRKKGFFNYSPDLIESKFFNYA